MKTAEPKSATPSLLQRKANAAPFFQPEESRDAFFGSQTNTAEPFFQPAAPPVQAKCAACEQEEKVQKKEEEEVQPKIQPKLKIGAPDDPYEKQADAIADKVVQRMAAPAPAPGADQEEKLQRKEEEVDKTEEQVQMKPIFDSATPPDDNTLQRKCADCEKEESDKVQRKESGDESSASPDISSRLNSSKGGGSPLPDNTRTQMESAMGADFSGVRVHTGSEAAGMSNDIQAQAFTHGSDVYFNEGKYSPGSTDGQRLLAHELVHTVQQGAVVRTKQDISKTSSPSVQRNAWDSFKSGLKSVGKTLSAGLDWVKSKLKAGLNWAAEALIPGYSLLNVILGKNLITDEPVARSGVNLVKGYMELIPVIGKVLFNELQDTATLTQAGIWTEAQVAKFGINFDDLAKRMTMMWEEVSVIRGIDYNLRIFKKYIGPVLGKFVAFSRVMEQKMKELRLEGALRLVGATELLTALKNDPIAFKKAVDDPTSILSNFMDALKKGFNQFKDKFSFHFETALLGWLFGKAAEMGIQMPKNLSIAGLFQLVAQLVGVTFGQIKTLVIQKLGPAGQKVFAEIEKDVKIVQRVIKEGPIALWEMVKEYLTNLKEMVFSKVTELVTTEIIKAAVTKLVSMLNPAGAIIQLVMTLYKVIKFFIDNWNTIKQIATGIINSITKVALGKLDDAADWIEGILGQGMKLIIGFLASIFGLSGIVDKVKGVIKKITAPIIKARDKAIDWLVKKGKALFNKVLGKDDKKDEKGGKAASLAPVDQEIEKLGVEKKKDGEITQEEATSIAGKVKKDQGGLIDTVSVLDGGDTWDFDYIQRTKKLKKEKEKKKENDIIPGPLYNGFGTSLYVERLTKANTGKGQKASKAKHNPNMAKLNFRSYGGGVYYVRGHILSEALGGSASWENLTPLTQFTNTQLHEPSVEMPIKSAIKEDNTVEYSVSVNYGRPSNDDMIKKVKRSKSFDADEKAQIIWVLEGEQFVPITLECQAFIIREKADGTTEKTPLVNTIISNEIEPYVEYDADGNLVLNDMP